MASPVKEAFFLGLLHHYGYATIGVIILLESMGAPLPGESLLVASALLAATGRLDIVLVVAVATIGAILGDNAGFLIGRRLGLPLLARHGRRLGLTEQRLRLGRYLFRRHGGKVVFCGRFIAFLRTFAALLAGANAMPWRIFLVCNALGGAAWCSLYGFGAYLLGDLFQRLAAPFAIVAGAIAAAVLLPALIFLKRNETRLLAKIGRDDA